MTADTPKSPTLMEEFTDTIDPEYAGIRLDKWLSDAIESLTRTRVKALIGSGAVSRNGTVFTDASWKIREGETFSLKIPPIETAVPQGEAIALDVYFEDDSLIVLNKPAGMVVHPAAGNWSGTLVNALIAHCGDSLSGIGGVARPGIVHRLDKDTSGLIVVAKNDAAHLKLTTAFAAHDIERAYHAIAIGAPRPSIGTIDAALARAVGDRKKMAVVPPQSTRPDQRHAITHFKIEEHFGRGRAKLAGDAVASLIECKLETGRTHQIRVHLSHLGYPLIGDPLYGRGPGVGGLKPGDDAADTALRVLKTFNRQALHARILGFAHPVTGDDLWFKADPPKDFTNLIGVLRAL